MRKKDVKIDEIYIYEGKYCKLIKIGYTTCRLMVVESGDIINNVGYSYLQPYIDK